MLNYVNCGHTPPLILRQGGVERRLEATATVLGLFRSWECSIGQAHIEPGDVSGIFSVGVTESTASNGKVEQEVEDFRAGERPHDNLTLVVARGQ